MLQIEEEMVPPFFHDFEAVIWQVMPDLMTGQLAVLTYDSARHGSMHSVDLASGAVSSLQGHDFAWHHILGLQGGVLVLEEMEKGGLPVSKSLRGIELASGRDLWRIEGQRFMGMLAGGLMLRALEAPALASLLDLPTGQITSLAEPDVEDLVRARAEAHQEKLAAAMQFPNAVLPSDPLHAALREHGDFPASSLLFHCLLPSGNAAIAWHAGLAGQFALSLTWGHAGGSWQTIQLQADMANMNPEPFFIFQGRIMAVQDRTRLVVINS